MNDILNESDPRFVRDLNFQPREKWAGHWRSGRLYPLYNVVENNGSFFVSQNGKMKAEPYVVYNETTGEYTANEGWKLKQPSADSRISARGGGGGGGGLTPEDVQEMIAGKQDIISDLATIRSGAAAGASAYKKPSGGIPKSDLSSAVKASLENADLVSTKQDTIEDLSTIRSGATAGASAYQKPATGIPSSDLASGVIPDVSGKQDTLVSGTNIKTVNGESILGSGNITAGDPNAVKYTEQSLSDAQKTQARTNIGAQDSLVSGTNIKTINQNSLLGSGDITIEDGVGFESIETPQTPDGTALINLTNGDTITLDLNHNHPAYYSKVAETSNPSGGFLPDVVYSLGTLTGTVTFALAAAVTGNVNHYFWMFDTGSTAPTITWPTGITWADGSAPTVSASKHYEVSILGGIAYYSEV